MPRHDTKHTLQVSVDEGVHVADVAERIVPGGAGLVQGLVRAKREALRGLAAMIDANVRELDRMDAAIPDPDRPRWHGGIGRGLLLVAVKRVAAVHATISRAEASLLTKLSDSLAADPGPPPDHAPRRPEKVKIE